MFYNTGISTYLWILTNAKPADRKGSVQLIDATGLGSKLRNSIGSKRVEISDENRNVIVRAFAGTESDGGKTTVPVKRFVNRDFAYWAVTVERPLQLRFECNSVTIDDVVDHKMLGNIVGLVEALTAFGDRTYLNREKFNRELLHHLRDHGLTLTAAQVKTLWQTIGVHDDAADICRYTSGAKKGEIEADPALRDIENVPFGWGGHPKTHEALEQTVQAFFDAEVKPHVDNAWIDWAKTKTGYEIPFSRHFYTYEPPRALEEIDADLNRVVREIMAMLREVEA
ncbi:MAG: hypothetical protein WAU24_07190, partial [Chitinophagaceae bacterium]